MLHPLLRVVGLLAVASIAVADDVPRKSLPPSKLALEIEKLRALEPGERLKFVEKRAGANDPYAAVTKGDLVATVVERGVIEAANSVDLACKVKARKEGSAATTIKWVVDDGALVKKGDKLAALDDSAFRDDLKAAAAKVEEAEAALNAASEAAKASEQENGIEVRLTEVALKMAELELKDVSSEKAKQMLELTVEAAKLKVERALGRAKASQVKAHAEIQSRKTTLTQLTAKQKRVEAEIANCVLTAPCDGLAIYFVPTTNRFGAANAFVAPGEPVREGQKLLRVADLKEFALATRIHEAVISTIRSGQATQVRVDAYPGKLLSGKVSQIASVAATDDFLRTDIKVYPVTIKIEPPIPGLKPGMSAEVRIETGTHKGVLQVPLKSIVSVGRDQFCFVKKGQELVERKIVHGARSASEVEIKEGLDDKELVVADVAGLLRK